MLLGSSGSDKGGDFSARMVNLTDQFGDRVTTINIDLGVTVESKLHVCLAQLPIPPDDAIATDAARPLTVAALTQLLVGGGVHVGPALAEMVPGNEPLLIVLPEFALASSDWAAVDTAVRGMARPLIVLAGFGAAPGGTVLDWAAAATGAGETRRRLAWNQADNGIGRVRRVNGGWCWVHAPGDTHCIAYLKTVAEQNVEAAQLPDMQFGRTITHLRFDDIDLFPLICADMLQLPGDHPDGAQARIAQALQGIAADRPAMVVGSLLQHGYNNNWVRAIDSLLVQVLAGRPGLVALANIADDRVFAAEHEDQWRSLTGVFGKWDELTKGQANLPCGRRVKTNFVVGAVIRHSDAMLASGAVDWGPYGPVDGKFVWHADMLAPVSDMGLPAPVTLPPPPHACEISRFLRRHPGDLNWSPRLRDGSAAIAAHLATGTAPQAKQILNALMHGPGEGAVDPDALHEIGHQQAVQHGLHALATLTTIDGTGWQPTVGQQGQLRQEASRRHLLVWRDARKTKMQMRAILSNWQQQAGEHPDLIVLAQSHFGDIDEGAVAEVRRDDFSAPPAAAAGAIGTLADEQSDYTAPRGRRRVSVVSLAAVASVYAEHQTGVDDMPLVDALNARLAAAFPGEAA
ncbi:MAG: ABC-three component system protein [Sphingomonadales bacterium]